MKVIETAAVSFLAVAANAQEWQIADNLVVTATSAVDATFQVYPDFDPNEPLLHGWRGEDLEYLVVVDKQPGGQKERLYWDGVLDELKAQSDDGNVTVLAEGSYANAAGTTMTYKLLEWQDEQEPTIQALHLVVGKRDAFWLMASSLTGDIDYMTEQTILLFRGSYIGSAKQP
ncbi:MAG: hypothetical protein AAGH76_15020 [Pseudomonadota bacterium]